MKLVVFYKRTNFRCIGHMSLACTGCPLRFKFIIETQEAVLPQLCLYLISDYETGNWIRGLGGPLDGPHCYNIQNGVPIELLSFKFNPEASQLEWKTASEINNDYFSVQYSEDLEYWEELGEVLGSGTTNSINEYSFAIEKSGYYRIEQFDFDGKSEAFNPIYAQIQKDEFENDSILRIMNRIGQTIRFDQMKEGEIYFLQFERNEPKKIIYNKYWKAKIQYQVNN